MALQIIKQANFTAVKTGDCVAYWYCNVESYLTFSITWKCRLERHRVVIENSPCSMIRTCDRFAALCQSKKEITSMTISCISCNHLQNKFLIS